MNMKSKALLNNYLNISNKAFPFHELLANLSSKSISLSEDFDKLPSNIKELWLNAVAPDEPEKLLRRLSWDKIDLDQLSHMLSSSSNESDSKLDKSDPDCEWLDGLKEITSALKQQWNKPLLPYIEPSDDVKQLPFIDLWMPVKDRGIQILEDIITKQSLETSIEKKIFEDLGKSLLERLVYLGEQLLWSRFAENRGPGAMLLAHLGSEGDCKGPPLREYYESFIYQNRSDGLASIINEFPVFGRLIGTIFSLWIDSSKEILIRICTDREKLLDCFGIPNKALLKSLHQGLSDPHRGGRAVAILTFALNDQNHKVVYKPKDMRVDLVYQEALCDLNSNSTLPSLKTLKVLCCNEYGYMEFVPHQLCKSKEELILFYRNAGRLTAILNLLGCTDCHFENLIACGDQLVLIDTETLLEADLPDHIANASGEKAHTGPSELTKKFHGSVLRSGLLPCWMFIGQIKIATDISALGVNPPSEAKVPSRGWLGLNSDGMLAGRVRIPAEMPTSLPVDIGQANPLSDHLESFCAGFKHQCDVLVSRRNSWLASNGLLSRFAGLPRRIVLRATRVYFSIQNQQLLPDALRSPIHQAIKLEQLARSFLLSEDCPRHWRIFAAEINQMQQLDIPFFVHPIDGSDLPLIKTLKPIRNFIETSGLSASRKRLQELDSEAIEFQLKLIRGAIQARALRESRTASKSLNSNESSPIGEDQIPTNLGASTMVASQLLKTAIHDDQGNIDWLGMNLDADGDKFTFGPVGISLYSGSIGIACLLARLQRNGVYFNNNASTIGSKEAIKAILNPLNEMVVNQSDDWRLRWWRDQGFGISGCGGVLLALQCLQADIDTLDEKILCPKIIADRLLLSARKTFLLADMQLDIIGGVAGLIGPLLSANTAHSQELAVVCGERLLESQREDGAWSALSSQPTLLGFSHGTAGFAAALARLHATSGEPRFLEAAKRALSFERSKYSQEHKNWPDFRSQPEEDKESPLTFMNSWCHGAPGIALGRACLWGTALWDDQAAEEISTALQTTAQIRNEQTDHLCCGSLGLVALMRMLRNGPWGIPQSVIQACDNAIATQMNHALSRCSNKSFDLHCFGTKEANLLLPGFFTGLSGMGLVLMNDHQADSTLLNLMSAGLISAEVKTTIHN